MHTIQFIRWCTRRAPTHPHTGTQVQIQLHQNISTQQMHIFWVAERPSTSDTCCVTAHRPHSITLKNWTIYSCSRRFLHIAQLCNVNEYICENRWFVSFSPTRYIRADKPTRWKQKKIDNCFETSEKWSIEVKRRIEEDRVLHIAMPPQAHSPEMHGTRKRKRLESERETTLSNRMATDLLNNDPGIIVCWVVHVLCVCVWVECALVVGCCRISLNVFNFRSPKWTDGIWNIAQPQIQMDSTANIRLFGLRSSGRDSGGNVYQLFLVY